MADLTEDVAVRYPVAGGALMESGGAMLCGFPNGNYDHWFMVPGVLRLRDYDRM